MAYDPKPIQTQNVRLAPELKDLTEYLAENAHDLWAIGRIAEGWSYGPKRNDAKRKHPDLVPYGDLPDSERDYDRRASMETLKAVIALGYRIERVEPAS